MDNLIVSVIIITWNRRNEVLQTINAIYDQAFKQLEIIVIDNASNDGTVDALHQLHPEVRVIALDHNIGVAARNAGIAVARGDYIFCLDSDASPGYESIANLVMKFQTEPNVGVINSKIVNAFSKQLDGGPGWSYSEKDKEDQDKEFLSFSFSEGGAAIRKEVFAKAGLFWEQLFFGCEGFEFSLRVLDAGYDILYYPGSIVYHRAAEQSRIDGSQRDSMFFRNFLSIYLVRFPWWLMGIFMPLKIGATLIRGGRRGYLSSIAKSLLDFIRQIPLLLRQRKPIQHETARHYVQLQRQHGSLRWDLISWLRHKV